MHCDTKIRQSNPPAAFVLTEVLIAVAIFMLVSSALVYGYIQINRMSEWSAMSLAAQAKASEGAEQARAADWRPRDWPETNGPGTMDELAPTNYSESDFLDIPMQGQPAQLGSAYAVTTYISITNATINPPLRTIRADCVWTFPANGRVYSNTVILLRTADQ